MISTCQKTSNISVIIPVLNEAASIAQTIEHACDPDVLEIIVVDGGSSDDTAHQASKCGAKVLSTTAGRGRQMNYGAQTAKGDIILFLHGDTLLPKGFGNEISMALKKPSIVAGAFKLGINLKGLKPRFIEYCANLRSRFWQMPYGDQGIFVNRNLFLDIGGYDDQPILEDVLLIKKLQKIGRIQIIPQRIITSGRRWQRLGFIKTTMINQMIMLAHLFGISPQRLQGWYRISKKG